MTQSSSDLRPWLRVLSVFPEQIPHFDIGELPDAPEARYLILRDLDERGWQFASHRTAARLSCCEAGRAAERRDAGWETTLLWP